MRRAQPRCPVSPQTRRIFCLEKARAFFGLIFQKLKSLAAANRAQFFDLDIENPLGRGTLATFELPL